MRAPSTDREARTRRAILDAAASLLPKDAGASLAEIAATAGLGRTTVHRYFPTREALLSALAVEALDRLDAALTGCRLHEGSAPQVLRRLAEQLVPMADAFRFLEVGPRVWDLAGLDARWYRFADRIEAVVERGKREGDLRADLPTAFVVDLFAGSIWTSKDSVDDGRIAANDAPRLIVDVLLHGAAS